MRIRATIALVGVGLLSACGGGGAELSGVPEQTPALSGGTELSGVTVLTPPLQGGAEYLQDNGGGCQGAGPFSDVTENTRVTVRDEADAVIGVTTLGRGVRGGPVSLDCIFKWKVAVEDAKFYTIEVGERGELTFSRAELEEQSWSVEMQLGSRN